ncbi:MAG: HAMP domain-containing protein [Deltaproteobacteria bacterium]|nr:HAMP domain-containing protein [Deltaproteobacteria bacterium]
MTRFVWTSLAALGLLLGATLLAQRLVRARKSGMSVRLQVFLALACIVGAFAGGLGLLVVDRIDARARWLATEAAEGEAAVLAAVAESDMRRGHRTIEEVARDIASLAVQVPDRAGIAVLDRRQRVLAARGLDPSAPGSVPVLAPITVERRTIGFVRVVKSSVVVERLLADFAPTVLWTSLVLIGAAALAAIVIGRAVAHPIERLTAYAERAAEGDLRVAAPAAPYGREVKLLTAAIERMRRELEGRPFVETFAADLGHELKNPVAAIRASAEILEDGALDDPEQARRFVARIVESSSRVESILGDLLSLARIEARGVEDGPVVSLDAAVADGVPAELRDRVTLQIVEPMSVRGDRSWLARAVTNLVENALTHGSAERPVTITVRPERTEAVVSVVSQGAVSPHVRGRMFKRFVTTRAGQGGTGLGLAIVRAVAEAHGGRVELARSGPPEVEVRMILPQA